MKNIKELKPLFKLIKEEKGKLILASIIILAQGISEIFTGYLNGRSVESIAEMEIENAMLYLLIYFVIGLTFDGIFLHKANAILYKVESLLTRKLCFMTYQKSLDLPAVAFEEKSSGEIINRITNDADTLSFAFGRLLSMFSSLIASFIIMIYIFYNSWIVGVEILVLLGILLIVIKIYNPKLEKIHKERKKEQDFFTSLTTESIRGIREIKTLGIKSNLIKDMSDIMKRIFKKSEDEINIEKEFNIITRFIKSIIEVGTFVLCIILLYYGKVSLTFFIAMTYYIYRYMWLIENLSDFMQVYQKTVVSLGRVNEILENRLYADEKFGEVQLNDVKGIVEFKHVTFGYPNEDITLNDFCIKLEPNKKIAIVGKSGQGKTTLFNLLTRIFDPLEGNITLDGVNLSDLTEDSLRDNISIIRQEPFIFNRTIRENFQLVQPDISIEEIRECTKKAYIDDYIMSLPKQYDTMLGEGGVNLSGGQKQRLAIARTLSRKSKVILLDEATSALDNESQEYIKKTVDYLVKNHTVIIVAHRLSTIIDADIIYLVEKGKVIVSGTHEELMINNKTYKKLYQSESLNS